MVILLADAFQADLPKRLEAFGTVVQDMGKVAEAEIIIVRSKTKVTKDIIDAAPKLKFIIRGGVGVDTIDVPYAESKKIAVTNTPEASSVAVAELAFAMMVAMPANIAPADASMKQGKWLKKELERTELLGKTLGLVGIGRIAREVAVRAKAFGMRVIAYDKYVEKSDAAEMMGLDKVYAQADYLSLHTPLTDETKGMINAKSIAVMKKGMRIINTCRGQVVVEADVAAALSTGDLAGYAADVFYAEPPTGSPLLTAPHTLLAPHLGASTAENLVRLGDCIVERVQNYVKGAK
ncbi:MAG: hydroxyacid dehydrogenase [Spirochaetes bacterium GWD1_61_31]|nr:MAG: hydroxyacid dehydrogenase [Spirochaetes bacterium GWB1_60_80]OHD28553.1 MAG: hydroxyacid dehydrogenase [Spirochaetes bacterium GWC1_61_12]OHD37356.1 MAG: hydroxyacid dehydrogenase [Spirochaetes bacterium GWD1_61_31]OHD41850.1 MAG: hydroxyacid dehydrogenase [Spirochaetes bacterium GWE1_60_18]OHD57831.1 MAG: hydroxyacid dehydrogenase [Spirochaetes bacterium GWF1_60_12]HAP42571.1 hydroxyacid dehydrogenase [Spirochaetaceae bacterium]